MSLLRLRELLLGSLSILFDVLLLSQLTAVVRGLLRRIQNCRL